MNFLMKGAKYKNPMNTFQEQRAGMDNMIKSAREFAGTATKEGHSISQFALIMTKEVEYYITIPNNHHFGLAWYLHSKNHYDT